MKRKFTNSTERPAFNLAGKEEIVRFNWRTRLEHIFLMLSFTALVVTGVPQRFFYTSWGEGMVLLMGGIETVRVVHRLFAAMLVMESVFHVVNIIYSLAKTRRIPDMSPRPRDLQDLAEQLLYYFGLRQKGPAFGRYDYGQKFEYLGVVWGTAVMILTGLVMMFPAQFTMLLPGELVPAAKGIHGGEALLAFLVIVTWHLYGTHLKPSKFPFDATIFTGKISKARMLEEHPLEYARITGGALDEDGEEEDAPSGRGYEGVPQQHLSREVEPEGPVTPEGKYFRY